MEFAATVALCTLVIFGGILVLVEVGRRVGGRRLAREPEGARIGTGAVEGALFALLGLLLAFTFSGAAERFDRRRHLIIDEANAIGTAYLRVDLMPEAAQVLLRERFRVYVESRLATYREGATSREVADALARSQELQRDIWSQAVAASAGTASSYGPMLLLGVLNEMIDITTTRTMATRIHPPAIVFVMLVVLVFAAALIAGYATAGSGRRHWLPTTAFAALIALTVYIIVDMEFPRRGFLRVEDFDQALVEVRRSMDDGR